MIPHYISVTAMLTIDDSSDDGSNVSFGGGEGFDLSDDDGSDQSQHRNIVDLSYTDEEDEQHSKNDDDNGGGGSASSSHQQQVRKRSKEATKPKGTAKKGKSMKGKTEKKKTKTSPKANWRKTDEILQKLLVLMKLEMIEKREKRKEREKREKRKEREKRKRVEDYDLTDFEQWLELSEKFNRICAAVGGSKVRAALQFPKFAETNLLSAEEKQEFREQQRQRQQQQM